MGDHEIYIPKTNEEYVARRDVGMVVAEGYNNAGSACRAVKCVLDNLCATPAFHAVTFMRLDCNIIKQVPIDLGMVNFPTYITWNNGVLLGTYDVMVRHNDVPQNASELQANLDEWIKGLLPGLN